MTALVVPDLILPAVPSVDDWAERITAEWRRTVEGILEVGQLLIDAKDALPHGEFQSMIRDRLPFKDSTARYLMQIARNPVLSNREYLHALPASWSTLKDLAKLDPPQLQRMIATGVVSPNMTGVQASRFCGPDIDGDLKYQMAVAAFLEEHPEAEVYGDALMRRKTMRLILPRESGGGLTYIQVEDVRGPLPGASWHWPWLSGPTWLYEGPAGAPDVDLPEFTEDEWDEFRYMDHGDACMDALEAADVPLLEFFRFPKGGTVEHRSLGRRARAQWSDWGKRSCDLLDRRTYDPEYGGFIDAHEDCSEYHHVSGPVFVKRGWGEWVTVEFNDGQGGRQRRRYFEQDYHCSSAVKHALDTADPLSVSSWNVWNMEISKARCPGRTPGIGRWTGTQRWMRSSTTWNGYAPLRPCPSRKSSGVPPTGCRTTSPRPTSCTSTGRAV
jgi:hypothetical protein